MADVTDIEVNAFTVRDLKNYIESLDEEDLDRNIVCQFVGSQENGGAYNLLFEFVKVPDKPGQENLMQLRVFHPSIKLLPPITEREITGVEPARVELASVSDIQRFKDKN